jgi:hypothetical protein
MMYPPLEQKTPTEIKDYGVDWNKFLGSGITITTSVWDVPAGITKDSDGIDGRATVIRLSGGTAGQNYTLTNTIVTSAGERLDAAIEVQVRTAAAIAGI